MDKTVTGHGSGDPVEAVDSVATSDTVASSPPATHAPATTGLAQVSRGNYEIGDELARGGMGRILVARDRRLGRKVALKELLGAGDAVERFEREALVTSRLQHPAIVPVYEAGRWPSGEPFYAMKLVSGRSLDKVIATKRDLAERLGLLPTVIHIAEAIAYAHAERVIHRDLKPANVLVGDFGETVVIDWGLAKDLSDAGAVDLPAGPYRAPATSGELTMAGSVMGTPTYMPPEQATGATVDERADVYALGALLYHVLAGAPPYSGKDAGDILAQVIAGPPRALAGDVPEELVAIVAKAMAREPRDRYPTAKQLADELVRFQAGKLVSAHRYTAWQLVKRWVRRHRAPVVAAAALVVIGGAIGAVALVKIVSARDAATAALARAEAEQRASFEEQGRRELFDGHATRAAAYLAEAYASGEPSEALRLMLAQAMKPIDALVATVDTGSVDALAVSPDGAMFVTAGDRGVALWRVDGTRVAALADGTHAAADVQFSRDGTRVAVALGDAGIGVWDARDGHAIAQLDDRDHGTHVAFATDDRLVVGSIEGVALWDVGTRAEIASAKLEGVERVAATPDHIVVTAASSYAVLDGKLAIVASHDGDALAVSPDGERVAVAIEVPPAPDDANASPTTSIALVDPRDAKPAETFERTRADRVGFGPDGRHALGTGETADGGEVVVGVLGGAAFEARVGALDATAARIATADDAGTIRVWTADRALLATWPSNARTATYLAFAGAGRVVAGGEDGVRVWALPDRRDTAVFAGRVVGDTVDREVLARVAHCHAGVCSDVVELADPATGTTRATLDPGATVWWAEPARGGGRVATAAATGKVAIWDPARATKLAELDALAYTARFSPDGASLVTAGEQDAYVWDAATGRKLATLTGGDEIVTSARFSPDGARVVTGAQDGVARVYERDGRLVRALAGHADYLVEAAFDARGEHVVTASGDGTAGLWDVATGKRLATLGGHTTALRTASFSPDGKRVLTVGSEAARLWDADGGALVAILPSTDTLVGGAFVGTDLVATLAGDHATLWDANRGVPLLVLPPQVPLDPLRPIASLGEVAHLVHDPRQREDAFAAAADGSWIVVGATRVTLPRERRPASEIAALVAARSGWVLRAGGLVPAREGAHKTDESARVATLSKVYEFADDVVEADLLVPEGAIEPAAADATPIHRATLAIAAADPAAAHALVDGLPAVPDTDAAHLYELAWVRRGLGDATGAYRTMIAALHAATKPLAAAARRDASRFAAEAGVTPAEVLAALGTDLPRDKLLVLVADAYHDTGDDDVVAPVLAELAAVPQPDIQLQAHLRALASAQTAGQTREVVAHGLAVIALADAHRDVADRDVALDRVREVAFGAHAIYEKTFDERYGRTALVLERALIHSGVDTKEIRAAVEDIEMRIASGPSATYSDMDKPIIRRSIRGRIARLRRCYERVLAREPGVEGRVRVEMTIQAGKVVSARPTPAGGASGLPAVSACVAQELGKLVLPHIAYAPPIAITYPFVFHVAGR